MRVARDVSPETDAHRSQARPLSSERVFCRRLAPAILLRALIAAALLTVMSAPAAAQEATPAPGGPVERAAAWLLSQRNADGAFLGFDGNPDPGTSADAIIALAAARDAGVEVDLAPSVAYLEREALVFAQTGAGQAAKLVLATVAAGGDPRNVATVDAVSLIERSTDPELGLYGRGMFDHALVMLALAAAGEQVPDDAVAAAEGTQLDDGSWSWDPTGVAGDTNTTAVVVQALVAAGAGESEAVQRGIEYLRAAQLEDGGFPYQPGETAVTDANSTGIVVLALLAAGSDPDSDELGAALGALLALQNASGAFRYTAEPPDDNLFATLQALPAIAAALGSPAGPATPVA